MSALPPKADIDRARRDVRFGSLADIGVGPRHVRFTPESGHRNSVVECPLCAKSRDMRCSLFDHLVGRGEQRRRNSHAKGLCTFEIKCEYKFSRLFDRKISRVRALQNSIDVIGGALT